MTAPDRLLILDIETVPDRDRLPPDFEGFPKALSHKVVAISFVEAEIEHLDDGERYHLIECRSGGRGDSPERDLLAGFWSRFDRSRPRVVTWNGRGFDLPVLRLRAFVHGLRASGWYTAGDKWDNYRVRYAEERHCDLMESLGDYGAVRPNLSLDETAKALRLPGKTGVDGSMVEGLVAEGRIDAVRAYCEGDVLNLYLLYLRWGVLTGRIDRREEDRARGDLATYLAREAPERPHLAAFLEGLADPATAA